MFASCLKITNKVMHFSNEEDNNDTKDNIKMPDIYVLKIDEYIASNEFQHNSYLFVSIKKNSFTVWTDNIKVEIIENYKQESYCKALVKCLEKIRTYNAESIVIETLSNFVLDIFREIKKPSNSNQKKEQIYLVQLKTILKKFKNIEYNSL